ncbi:MAG: orotidine-5'-phosphate decarboxylase, partial [Gemmatimonadales bacterium]|nr:orotidine-5'-phosphate decarboxylase [Gemmatimonadales bacterium]
MAEVIVALDVASGEAVELLLDRLPAARWVKLGSVLMTREGPALVRALAARGLQVFLDLKWHDIPNTVAGAVAAARELGVSMATVHLVGGAAMLRAAAAERGPGLGLVGVTVLTSHDASSYARVMGREAVEIEAEVARLAATAIPSGLQGVVCSPHEAAAVRTIIGPEAWLIVPGIRGRDDTPGDQSRVAS